MRRIHLPPGVFMQLADPTGESLRAWLKARGLSYADLGGMVPVSKQFIGQLATGRKTTCRPEVAAKIEMILLPPPERRLPNDKPLFVARNSKFDGGRVQKRRSPVRVSGK